MPMGYGGICLIKVIVLLVKCFLSLNVDLKNFTVVALSLKITFYLYFYLIMY